MAMDDCVRGCARKVPARTPRQLRQLQFHWGKPPPAAEPRIWICMEVTSGMPRTSRGQERSAVGEIHRHFEANAQVGVGGFSPHGAVLLLLSRGIPATPLSPRQAGGQMVLWEEIWLALVGSA